MRIETRRIALAAASIALLAGCTTAGTSASQLKTDNWGEANRQTMAAQIIDPTPTYEYASPETSGTQVAGAIERVRTDRVKKPERVKTSTTVTGGSGN